ncbi:hypothetical protein EDD11_000077 [Mortierella claussenii]|nr:hypothetical protein EDD11_000077 [Mortierella claussenii]
MTTATTMSHHNNNSIRAIDKESVHRICSGQVVLDMATAVKELLENSLDAGSTSIVIKFRQSGLESITVTDNGCGITDVNLETLALKHYTSKLRSFNDLAQVRSFGFRGEALSSLCALAQLTVTTSTGTSLTGVLVEYNSDGLIQSKTPTPMTKGTIVKICNLFEGMPVRRNEFVKNIKREFAKCIGLIQAYALIVPNVRISCVSQVDKKPAVTQIATSGNASVRQNIINVFGPKAMIDVVDFELKLVEGTSGSGNGNRVKSEEDNPKDQKEDDQDEDDNNDDDDELNQKGDIVLTGYISSPAFGKGRSSADRQYIFINGRPCVLPKIARVINEVYHSFNTNQSPFLVANLILPTSYYDVNVSPDKRTIFLHNERMIVEELRNKLTELFEPSRCTFAVSEARQLIKKPDLASRLQSGSASLSSSTDDAVSGDEMVEEEGATLARTSLASSESTLVTAVDSSSKIATRLEQTTLKDRMIPIPRPESFSKRKAQDEGSEPEDEKAEDIREPQEPKLGLADKERSLSPDAREMLEKTSHLVSPSSVNHGLSDPTLEVMEGYDPLDDRTREEDVQHPTSDSEEEQGAELLSRPSKFQRIVVLDTAEAQQHEGYREWMEVSFDMDEQRRKRALQMKILQETQRLEHERRKLRKEMMQKRQLLRRQQQYQETMSAAAIDNVDEVEGEHITGVRNRRKSRRLRNLKLSDASFANMDDVKAQKSLSRVISKGDFARMKILGQFNKAFIVARLDNYSAVASPVDLSQVPQEQQGPTSRRQQQRQRQQQRGLLVSSDIFVIDQHASDEKYNFETLQAKTVFSTQRLFQPKKLYLTAQEEMTVVEHMKMLNKNGFYLDYDPEAAVSHRLQLRTLPVSEKVVFEVKDFEELVFLLSQQTALPAGHGHVDGDVPDDQDRGISDGSGAASLLSEQKMVRCSKVRNLFASRACRRSVMIGHVLNHSQMKRIVRHMGEIDQPWNCPHGRPTMRHLLDLMELEQQGRRRGQLDNDDDDEDGDILLEDEDQDDDLRQRMQMLEQERERDRDRDRTGAFDPVAVKRPTKHQGSLFRQFMAIPSSGN